MTADRARHCSRVLKDKPDQAPAPKTFEVTSVTPHLFEDVDA